MPTLALESFTISKTSKGKTMNEHYKPPRKHQTWDLLTAILLGAALSILAMAYFDILWG
jgi:hypothetical protein